MGPWQTLDIEAAGSRTGGSLTGSSSSVVVGWPVVTHFRSTCAAASFLNATCAAAWRVGDGLVVSMGVASSSRAGGVLPAAKVVYLRRQQAPALVLLVAAQLQHLMVAGALVSRLLSVAGNPPHLTRAPVLLHHSVMQHVLWHGVLKPALLRLHDKLTEQQGRWHVA